MPSISDYDRLPPDTKAAVDTVILEARRTQAIAIHPHKTGNVYAYPQGIGYAWGVAGTEINASGTVGVRQASA